MSRLAFRDRVAQFLMARPNQWIPAEAFEPVGGKQAWRTRISNCRTELGMTIENRCRKVRGADGEPFTISEYRFVPPVGQMGLFQEPQEIGATQR